MGSAPRTWVAGKPNWFGIRVKSWIVPPMAVGMLIRRSPPVQEAALNEWVEVIEIIFEKLQRVCEDISDIGEHNRVFTRTSGEVTGDRFQGLEWVQLPRVAGPDCEIAPEWVVADINYASDVLAYGVR